MGELMDLARKVAARRSQESPSEVKSVDRVSVVTPPHSPPRPEHSALRMYEINELITPTCVNRAPERSSTSLLTIAREAKRRRDAEVRAHLEATVPADILRLADEVERERVAGLATWNEARESRQRRTDQAAVAAAQEESQEDARETTDYITRIQALYLAAVAGILPVEPVPLSRGHTVTEPNRWVLRTMELIGAIRGRYSPSQYLARTLAERDGLDTLARWWSNYQSLKRIK